MIITFLLYATLYTSVVAQEATGANIIETIENNFSPLHTITKSSKIYGDVLALYGNLTSTEKQELDKFNNVLSYLKKNYNARHEIDGKVDLALRFDQSKDQNLLKLNSGFSIDMGGYPWRLELSNRIDVTSQNGNLQEDISEWLLTYDYYINPNIQLFTFGNRYSDNFLAIDQRYEIGGGIVIDLQPNIKSSYNSKDPNNKSTNPAEKRMLYRQLNKTGQEILENIELPSYDNTSWYHQLLKPSKRVHKAKITKSIEDYRLDQVYSANSQYRKWRVAAIFGIFSETEDATLAIKDTVLQSIQLNDTMNQVLVITDLERRVPSRHRIRPEIGGSLGVRGNKFTIKVRAYAKLPFERRTTEVFSHPTNSPENDVTV